MKYLSGRVLRHCQSYFWVAFIDKLEVNSKGSTIVDSPRNQCECANRQSEWFVFNNHLAMPEYIVDFEYVTRVRKQQQQQHHQ